MFRLVPGKSSTTLRESKVFVFLKLGVLPCCLAFAIWYEGGRGNGANRDFNTQ